MTISKNFRTRAPGGAALENELQSSITKLQGALAQAGSAALTSSALAQDPELVSDFLTESRGHLSTIESQLLTIERDPANADALNSIFRAVHNIKGLAGFLEFVHVQAAAHEMETLLDRARNRELTMAPAVVDVLLEGVDYLKTWIQYIDAAFSGKPRQEPGDAGPLIERIRDRASGAQPAKAPEAISVAEPVTVAPNAAVESAAPATTSANGGEARSVKVDTDKLDYLLDMVGEMVIAQSLIRHDPDLAKIQNPRLLWNVSQAARITAEVQKTAMAMRMLPIGAVFQRMRRVLRDLTRRSGKQAELEISGEETELDRTIVEGLADPLMHMVRNSLDHGIEPPEERIAAGKPRKAKVILRAYHQGGNILIEVGDDGRGLNREKILKKAKEKGLIKRGDHMADNDVFALIFEPGFSTADQITNISGRGVGMDVVKKQIQKLRGSIEIQSVRGQGVTFLLKLPFTLAIIDGLVIGVGEERYVVPISAVYEILRPTAEMVSTSPGGSEVVLIRGALLPVVRLNRRLGVPGRSKILAENLFVICQGRGQRFCLAVDELIGKQEVAIKSLGRILKNVPGIAGGAILGDGRVGLILDVEAIQEGFGNAAA